jgi:predicted nucleic acid-binding Zn ribbon protein
MPVCQVPSEAEHLTMSMKTGILLTDEKTDIRAISPVLYIVRSAVILIWLVLSATFIA